MHAERKYLITGASGFLGSHLTVEMAKEGYSVTALVRPLKGCSGYERFKDVCRLWGADSGILSHIRVVEGDITLPELGLGKDLYRGLICSVTEIINCAGDTSFTEKKRESLERVNIHGLKNLLEMAVKGRCSFFHQVSTAYIFGKTTGICREQLVSPKEFTNVYEETKCRSEHLVWDICKANGIRLNIYRPGIVCGESREGRTFRFNGLYYPLKSLKRLIDSFKNDLLENDGEKAARMGVGIAGNNKLMFPLAIQVKEGSGINVIPVDYFTYIFLNILKNRSEHDIYHIVQEKSCPVKDIIEYTRRYFLVEGLDITSNEKENGPLERIFNLYNEVYLPYLQDRRVFSSENIRHFRDNGFDDQFTCERFKVCMDYAAKTDWGKNLFA